MRIWLPLAILLSVAWLLAVSVIASRGGDDGPATPLAGDAAALLRESQAAMLELDSLQAEVTTSWEGREDTYRVVWQSPDSFYVLAPYAVAEYETGKDPVITDYGFVEAMAIGDRMYNRQCAKEEADCGPWGVGVRDGTYVPAFAGGFLDPIWAVQLLGLVSDGRIIGQEDVDGVACIRLRGSGDVTRAMIASWRRAEEVRGPLYWGEECEGTPTEAGEYSQEQCHSLTLDEYIAGYEDDVRRQDENPPSVEVWIGQEDALLRRLEFPQGEEPAEGSFTFSRFDEVTVEAPK